MSAQLLTIAMITREALRVLENNLVFTRNVSREYEDQFARDGAKIGDVVNVRKPVRYIVSKGTALDLQDAEETSVPVRLDTQAHVDFQFSTRDLTLNIDDFSKRFISPAVAAIANQIDADGLLMAKNSVANAVGTPGTTPNALLTYLNAGVALDNNATPQDGMRNLFVTPRMQATMVDALKGLFQSSSELSSQYRKGLMGTTAGFDWNMDQNCATHTVGVLGGTPLVNGASQTGDSLITDGWTGAVAVRLNRGDRFTLPLVYSVNPQSRQGTGDLQVFLVTAPTASDGSGNMTIPIYPPIITSGAKQTVTVSPANDAALTIIGAASTASPTGVAMHRDAFTLVTADLKVPNGTDMADRVSSKKLGISLRIVRDYNISTDQWPTRIDVLYGWAALRPELACLVQA